MTTFDILQPDLNLHKRCFIEASAGCGKTFSIENIVTRLVIDEEKPLDIEKILVLTFTKEATSELKARIRKNLENVKNQLEQSDETSFEYVRAYFQHGEDRKKKAIRNLNEALAKFDLAQIFTIHKFCFMQLKEFLFEAELKLSEDIEKSNVSLKTYEKIVRDYLSFGLDKENFSKPQLKLLLSYYKNDFGALLQAVVLQLVKEVEVVKCKSWKEICFECEEEIKKIKNESPINFEDVIDLYMRAAPLFKGAVNRQKEISKSLKNAIYHLSLFLKEGGIDNFIELYPILKSVFDESNLKKSSLKMIDDHSAFIAFHKKLSQKLFPLLDSAVKKENLIASLCFECQKLLNLFFEKNKILTPNNILTKFNLLIDQKEVALSILINYQAVIVDEFQDTDPTQWQILSKLFIDDISKPIPIYLVGDPKQSIYGFRRADIYTYLKAAKMLKVENVSTLNVNYRSQPGLIDALNALFAKKKNKWLFLPKLKSSLTYQEVESSPGIEKRDFHDTKKSLHFILAEQKEKIGAIPSKQLEEKIFFPFFVNEILKFHDELKMPFRSFALLVRDRFQAARLKSFLKKCHLPFMSTRSESLQGLFIVESFLQIFLAVLHSKKREYILALKLNSIMQLPEDAFAEEGQIFNLFSSLREILFEKGFLPFYQALMNKPIFLNQSINERLLSEEEGLYQYIELEQMKDLLLQEEVNGADPYYLLKILEDLCRLTALPEKVHPLRQNFEEDALQILTLHMSKGLEFEVVFALGLVNQVRGKDDLIFDTETHKLTPPSLLSDESLLEYQQEQDAEKMRQLYVAMTRAKQRLYLPYVISEKETNFEKCSPIESFFHHIDLKDKELIDFISNQKEMSYTFCNEDIEVIDKKKLNVINLVKPTILKKTFLKESKHSFTSLASHHSMSITDLKAPVDFSNPIKTIHTLPAGANTGVLFHKIFEEINFERKDVKIEEYISQTKYEPWKEVIENLIYKVLKTPIQTPFSTFTLSDLKTSQTLKEIEFLYPMKGDEKITEMTHLGDYMQGVIDLVCCYEGKYYLIDYKTNWLGSEESDYLNLLTPMKENQYFLQAKIYREALKKYLGLYDDREFNTCFGGTLYWFIRGVDAKGFGLHLVDDVNLSSKRNACFI